MNRFQIGVVLKILAFAFAIVALIGLFVHSVHDVREAAARIQTINNLKQIALGLHGADATYGKLPPATGLYGTDVAKFANWSEMGTVFVHLIPFVEAYDLHRRMRESNGKLFNSNPPTFSTFVSPEDPSDNGGPAGCSFAANLRAFTTAGLKSKFDGAIDSQRWDFPHGDASILASFPDGTARTMAFTTKYSVCKSETVTTYFTSARIQPSPFFGMDAPRFPAGPANTPKQIFQTVPEPGDCNISWTPQSYYRREIMAAMFDGSVGLIRADISPEVWGKLQHPADGDVSIKPWD